MIDPRSKIAQAPGQLPPTEQDTHHPALPVTTILFHAFAVLDATPSFNVAELCKPHGGFPSKVFENVYDSQPLVIRVSAGELKYPPLHKQDAEAGDECAVPWQVPQFVVLDWYVLEAHAHESLLIFMFGSGHVHTPLTPDAEGSGQ